jgi:hypothetical protein
MGETVRRPVQAGQGPCGPAGGPTPMTPHPHSILPSTADGLQTTVTTFRHATASQLRRLHYPYGTQKGKEVRSRRHLKRLTDLGLLRRVRGVYNGVAEYVYMPPNIKSQPDAHTLDIIELYVRHVEAFNISDPTYQKNPETLIYVPEPWCHVPLGHMTLKPDGFIDTDHMKYYLEMDRGTEFASQLAEKMRRYQRAYEQWPEDVFPLCVWVVHNVARQRFIESVIKRQAEPRLFETCLFNEFTSLVVDN